MPRRYRDDYYDNMPYQATYPAQMNYPSQGQSLLNFSQFQPTFIGKPVNEMAGAMKAFRTQADMILDTRDALGQTLAMAQVHPNDRGMVVERKQWLDEGIKDVATTGDFGPATVKMRNLLNKFKQDPGLPAAESRYAQYLTTIKDINDKASKLEISPQTMEVKKARAEAAFGQTLPDPITGLYDATYNPGPIEKDFDFHTFLTQFMNNERMEMRTVGYTPVTYDVPIDPNNPNSPTTKKIVSWQHGQYGIITEDELVKKAVAAMKDNGQVKPTSRDLTTYYNSKGNPITEDQLLERIARPYAQSFATENTQLDYDRVAYETQTTPPTSTWQPFAISSGTDVETPLSGGIDGYLNSGTVRSTGETNSQGVTGGLGPIAETVIDPPTDKFKYDVPSLLKDIVKKDYINTILKNSPYNTTLEELSTKDPLKEDDRNNVNKALDWVNAEMKRLDVPNIINDLYPISDPNQVAQTNFEMFSGTVGDIPKIKYVNNTPIPPFDINKLLIYDEKTKEPISGEDFLEELNPHSGGTVDVTLTLRGVYNPDNTLALKTGNDALLNARVYEANGKSFIIGSNTVPVSDSDKMQRDIGKSKFIAGYYMDFNWPQVKESQYKANNLGKTADGRPVFNYEFKTGINQRAEFIKAITTNIGDISKLESMMKLNPNNTDRDFKLLNTYLNTGVITANTPGEITDVITNIQDLSNNPYYRTK